MIFDITDIKTDTLIKVPHSYYKHNRDLCLENLKTKLGLAANATGTIFMKGHSLYMNNNDDDATCNDKPEVNFLYLFGFRGYFGLYALLDLETGEVTISLPELSEEEQVFESSLTIKTDPSTFGVDKFISEGDLQKTLLLKGAEAPVFVYDGFNRFEVVVHKPRFEWLKHLK